MFSKLLNPAGYLQRFVIISILLSIIFAPGMGYSYLARAKSSQNYQNNDGPWSEEMLFHKIDEKSVTSIIQSDEASAGLVNQLDHSSEWGVLSINFQSIYNDYSTESADDFTVPAADGSWIIHQVDAIGWCKDIDTGEPISCSNLESANVRIYRDASGLPADTAFYSADEQNISVVSSSGNVAKRYTIELETPAVLAEGKYWISVQINRDFEDGFWYWNLRTIQSGSIYAWRNPGGGWGVSSIWTNISDLQPDADDPDINFYLGGWKGHPYKKEISTGAVYGRQRRQPPSAETAAPSAAGTRPCRSHCERLQSRARR